MGWRISRLLLLLGLLLFSGLFWWLPEALVQPALALTGTHAVRTDYYIVGPRLTAMNRSGRPRFILTARRLVHFLNRKQTILIQPHLIQYGRHTVTTTTAQKGFVSAHGHTVIMRGNVHIYRTANGRMGPTRVKTNTLTVHLTHVQMDHP